MMHITCVQAYSPLGKGTRQVLEDKTVSSVAQRRGRSNAQVSSQRSVLHHVIITKGRGKLPKSIQILKAIHRQSDTQEICTQQR